MILHIIYIYIYIYVYLSLSLYIYIYIYTRSPMLMVFAAVTLAKLLVEVAGSTENNIRSVFIISNRETSN